MFLSYLLTAKITKNILFSKDLCVIHRIAALQRRGIIAFLLKLHKQNQPLLVLTLIYLDLTNF